eukprot:TRINITY_DN21569_c0_g1_i2.p1 TRINITY_DN21569_c0_g1~~TRINITY_DN21569_c0_g1_i2.p1  ORF type:complete len:375 (-),score=96.98 TRINITY_DN21569_c0_g1_i2:36-1094(-)
MGDADAAKRKSWWDPWASDNALMASIPAALGGRLCSRAELQDFACLPAGSSERAALLALRARAALRAQEAPTEVFEDGLRRLQRWAEGVQWPGQSEARPFGSVSPRWKLLGFQSPDPRRDFRTGLLALDCLVHLFESRPLDAHPMVIEAGSQALDYPFAVASINMTQLLAWYLSLIEGPNPAGSDSAVEPLADRRQLLAWARLCSNSGPASRAGAAAESVASAVASRGNCGSEADGGEATAASSEVESGAAGQTLDACSGGSPDAAGAVACAFLELHCAAMQRMHLAWRRRRLAAPGGRLSFSEFGGALQETLAVVDDVLRTAPLQDVSELARISDADAPASWFASLADALG